MCLWRGDPRRRLSPGAGGTTHALPTAAMTPPRRALGFNLHFPQEGKVGSHRVAKNQEKSPTPRLFFSGRLSSSPFQERRTISPFHSSQLLREVSALNPDGNYAIIKGLFVAGQGVKTPLPPQF